MLNLEKLQTAIDSKKPGKLAAIQNQVYRARVPGGWLVFVGYNGGINGGTFYPDAKHEWNGESLPG